MIGYLKGKVISYGDGEVILENGGIGFTVNCSSSVYEKLLSDGEGEAFIYTAVKEDDISLYGFSSLEEKKAFLSLISVSGVGPKMGITVLSQMKLKTLVAAISSGDVKTLSSVKGLGKKTAERIILELKEKIGGEEFDLTDVATKSSVVADKDAVLALMSLGFNKTESERAVIDAQNSGAKGIENVIAYALKNIK